MFNLSRVLDQAKQDANWVIGIRRQLHMHPEIGFDLPKTSEIVRNTLRELNIPFDYPVAESGMVAQIGSRGPCVALRADMDALLINEEADVEFRSQEHGKMHACGHDCHTAMLLGAAKILKGMEGQLPGIVKLIFQPAEEVGGGAARMIEEGALKNPDVQRIFGIHVWPMKGATTGTICGRKGGLLAAVGSFRMRVRGLGGHGAFPHTVQDPILAAAHIVTALQSIVSRECDPVKPSVISVTSISGGNTYNVIPDEVEMRGTIRSLELSGIDTLRQSVLRVATSVAQGMRCTVSLENIDNETEYPPTVNDEHCWELAKRVAREYVGDQQVVEIDPVMGAEDFSFYTTHAKGCFIALGIYNPDIGATAMVHNSKFKVDESALHLGTAMHVGFALKSLEELSTQ